MSARIRVPVRADAWLRLGISRPLIDLAASLEPTAVAVSAAIREQRSCWERIVVSVERHDGVIRGAVVLQRVGPLRWSALPLVVDEAIVPVLARVVDRTWAENVEGTGSHVAPLVPHLRRATDRGGRLDFFASDGPAAAFSPLDGRTRAATSADVPALLEVFRGYRYERLPTPRSRRQTMQRIVTNGFAVIAEVDGEVVGAMVADGVGRDTVLMAEATVVPEHRGTGLGWALADRITAQAGVLGLAACGSIVNENPMDAHARKPPSAEWWHVKLRPSRWRGSDAWRARRVRRIHRRMDRVERAKRRLRSAASRW